MEANPAGEATETLGKLKIGETIYTAPQGPQGAPGPANKLIIGTVTDGEQAAASITGEAPNQQLNLVLPKGEQGDPGQNAVNPFKGWFTTDNIPTTGQEGDYCNVSNTSVTPHTVTIYRWSTAQNAFVDTSEVPDTANGETFASSEELNQVAIDNSHLVNPVNTVDSTKPVLAQAKDVKEKLLDKLVGEIREFTYNGSEDWLQNVANFFVDKNGVLFALLMNDGSFVPLVKNADQKKIDSLAENVSSESPYDDENVIKYFTDENNVCFARLLKNGTLVIEKAYIGSLETEQGIQDTVSEKTLSEIVGLLSLGLDNIELSNNPRLWKVLGNVVTGNGVFLNAQNENNLNLRPCISIIDDDTVDNQIPSSSGSSTPTTNAGGYFSVLFPLILSLSAKYGKKYSVGLACEGHRVGLTPFKSSSDEYSSLNENGQAVKWLHDNMGWNVFNHSMTAQLPYADRTFAVQSIDSEEADTILHNGYYASKYAFSNTMVLELSTGKWYEVNSSKTAWVERTPTKKYAQMYYHDYNGGSWHFNRAFDFDYSWGEWFKRAEELGLPFEKLIVHNGSTTSAYSIAAGRKYAYASIRTTGTYNYPPLKAAINRIDGDPSGNQGDGQGLGYNVFDEVWFNGMKQRIDTCLADNSWVIIMTHTNDQEYFRNYYLSNKSYPNKDENYSSEWIIPLNHTEIQAIINGQQDYVSNPPQRLGINSWSEWHPAPGTHLDALYQLLKYAIDNGVDLVSPWEEYLNRGNILNLGVDKNGQGYTYSISTPLEIDEESFLTIGADMSIRYRNTNNSNN